MKKMLLIAAMFILSGCDDNNKAVTTQINESHAKPTESAKFDCKKGPISVECNITSGDQLGSGQWRHAVLNITNSDASFKMDGELFYRKDSRSSFVDGSKMSTIYLKGFKGDKAEITLSQSNEGSYLSVEVRDPNGKLMLTASK